MNIIVLVQDERLKQLIETLVLALIYPLVDITTESAKADVMIMDGQADAIPRLKDGHYVIHFLTPAQAIKASHVPREYRFRYRQFVDRSRAQREEKETPAIGKLLSYLAQLALKFNIA